MKLLLKSCAGFREAPVRGAWGGGWVGEQSLQQANGQENDQSISFIRCSWCSTSVKARYKVKTPWECFPILERTNHKHQQKMSLHWKYFLLKIGWVGENILFWRLVGWVKIFSFENWLVGSPKPSAAGRQPRAAVVPPGEYFNRRHSLAKNNQH